jgi:outer membrane protein OmpA-like peptidoglycan-associated protein
MKKLFIPIIVFVGIGINLTAQVKSSKEKRADKYDFNYSYDEAIDYYTRTKNLSVDGQRKLADSYHKINRNTEAEVAYAKLISMPEGNLPEDYYNYAMVLKSNGKYDEASKYMDKFKDLKPNDLRAKSYVANKDALGNLAKDNGSFKINHLNFNTDAEDFGACYYLNKIVFASSGANPKATAKTYNWNRKPFLNMYVSEVENGQLKSPEIFEKSLDGPMHDGPASFSKDGTFMAFTSNIYHLKRKDRVVRIEICFSNFKDGKWSKPELFGLDNKECSYGHPSLSADGNTMYFASDMPGGFGGVDIYKISKDEKGVWGKAVNMGDKINTEGDEMFPFFEENNKVLFFSSNGHYGLGGLDIYYCALNGPKFGRVHNAGFPLNTQYDDFSAIADEKLNAGYFSSNRVGGSGDDDIYSVDILKLDIGKKIEGLAIDKNTITIPNTFITLQDDKGNVIDTITTKVDGAYSFFVDSDRNFKLIGKKATYVDGDTLTNTFGTALIIKANVMLLKKEEFVAKQIIVGADLAVILELDAIYFDLDKFNIRPDAEIELKKIVKVMNDHPEIVVELRSYADCRATKEYNQVLSDKRAKVSAWYIKTRIDKPERIHGKGYGEMNLVSGCACEGTVVSTCSEVEFQKDRRTEFIIVEKTIPLPVLSDK